MISLFVVINIEFNAIAFRYDIGCEPVEVVREWVYVFIMAVLWHYLPEQFRTDYIVSGNNVLKV